MIKDFADRLNQLLKNDLPGVEAHKLMAPLTRPLKSFEIIDYPEAKVACVLLLFYPKNEDIYLALIKRPDYDGVHSGQISFPGGKWEVGDVDEKFTALRETEEEIGIPPSTITVIGKMSNVYIPPSNFFVYPFAGYVNALPQFYPDKKEVDHVVEMPLRVLLDDNIKSTITITRPEATFEAPCYIINGHSVWGATAIILSELEMILKKDPMF